MSDHDPPHPVPIDAELDLHAFAPRDVRSVVAEYVRAASDAGLQEVRIVHGRGTGVQRALVQSTLDRHPLVEAFRDAPGSHLGATIASIRPLRRNHPEGGDGRRALRSGP